MNADDPELAELLAQKLPRHAAPVDLVRKLAEQAHATPVRAPRPRRWIAPLVSALTAAAAVLLIVRVTQPTFLRAPVTTADVVDEAVNDYLRVVTSAHPIEIESGGIHQVKPWFTATGRLDFAPRVAFDGDDQFTLVGGSVGYFRDRKAAVFVFKIRLHTITLFVFRDDRDLVRSAEPDAHAARGINVLLWRDGDLGYSLVSDVARPDLETLARKIRGGT